MNYTKLFPEDYPLLMKQMEKQPPFMYLSGAPIPSDDHKFLCVVGSRKYNDYGRSACLDLIAGLKNYPIVIVSGMALGIDALAHEAALTYNLRTIAFPGSGLMESVIYPRNNLGLARRIVASGNTLLSPFDPDQGGDTWTFPVRNQIMAAISHATLVIQGDKESGTLLTANNALDMSRDVLVVPGSIYSDLSYAPNSLLREGAKPVTSSEDILELLGFDSDHARTDRTADLLRRGLEELPDDQKIVLRELQYKPMTSSELIEKLGISAAHFNIVITELELFGIVTGSHGVYRIGSSQP